MAVWKRILVSGSNISDLANDVGYATTGSNTFQGNQTINGDVVITGSLTAQQYILSSSVIYVTESNFSGSHVFGNSMDDTHQFTGSIYLTGSQYFSIADAGVATTGQIGWNTGDQTLDLGLSGSTGAIPVLQIGQQQVARVYNAQGTTITKGQVVYVSGSQGNRIAVKLASATNDANSAGTLGFVLDDIGNGEEGYIQTEGPLYKLNTTGLVAGGLVYLSSSAGQYTQTKPVAPLHEVRLGYVERVSATVGSIYIKIDNGYELEELHNVLITAPSSSGDLLILSGSVWINSKTLTGSYTLSGSLTTNDGVSVQSLTASIVSASSITGSLQGTSSWATNAISASFLPIGTYNITASWAESASQALTASFLPDGTYTITSSWAQSASQALIASSSTIINGRDDALEFLVFTNTTSSGVDTTSTQVLKNTGNSRYIRISPSNSEIRSYSIGTNNIQPINLTTMLPNGAGTINALGTWTFNNTIIGTSSWAVSASWAPAGAAPSVYNGNSNVSYPNLSTLYVSGSGVTISSPSSGIVSMSIGGGGTPGGSDTYIQFNSGSAFGGDGNLTYQYDTADNEAGKLSHTYGHDFRVYPYDINFKNSYAPLNQANSYKQQTGITHWQYRLNNTNESIYTFNALNGGTSLQIYGFKCDYGLIQNDGTDSFASRTGTILATWNNDTGGTPPIQDTYVYNDSTGELDTVVFSLVWNGTDVELWVDSGQCASTPYFNGVFTIFGSGQ